MTEVQDRNLDVVPNAVSGLEMEVVEGEVLLYHPQHARAVYLNPTAALVWGLCDGNRSVREIVRIIGESYPDASGLSEDVLKTLEQLRGNGVLAWR
jgi:hypothetical protein